MKNLNKLEMREFLKDSIREEVNFSLTDQNQGVAMPPIEKPLGPQEYSVELPDWRGLVKPRADLVELFEKRRSYRKFTDEKILAEELSYLLWATQGIRIYHPKRTLRMVPSAGNRHSFESYIVIHRALEDTRGEVLFKRGIWRYLPLSHSLAFTGCPEPLEELVSQAALDQGFLGRAPLVFIWSTLPYRTEWRYQEASVKVIALDAGHLCQNLYLSAGSIDCGICAVAAYNQDRADKLLGLDGKDEFVIYMAPLGKVHQD